MSTSDLQPANAPLLRKRTDAETRQSSTYACDNCSTLQVVTLNMSGTRREHQGAQAGQGGREAGKLQRGASPPLGVAWPTTSPSADPHMSDLVSCFPAMSALHLCRRAQLAGQKSKDGKKKAGKIEAGDGNQLQTQKETHMEEVTGKLETGGGA